jgi:glutaredoxin
VSFAAFVDWILRRPAAPPVPVILYSKPGCHLCEEMKREIARARTEIEYTLTEVDITNDQALVAAHGESIPVLEIGGRKAFKVRLSAADFSRKLARLGAEWQRARTLADGLRAERR